MVIIEGILPVLKPAGMTSHDCVGRLRRILKTKRIGHTGTLDPSVRGVLPLCVGTATRVAEYIQDLPKEYVGEMQIGRSTTTEDADGEVTAVQEVSPPLTEEEIRRAVAGFIGPVEQVPPMYSAVKVNGVRLHQMARQGVTVERKARTVTIYGIDILHMKLHQPFPEIGLRIECSKGTYVRTLCVDIGKALGYPAHMLSLVRTRSGPFELADCFSFEQIEEAAARGEAGKLFRPIDSALQQFPEIMVTASQVFDIENGKKLELNDSSLAEGRLVRVYSPDSRFLALYRVTLSDGIRLAKPEKVFRREAGGNV